MLNVSSQNQLLKNIFFVSSPSPVVEEFDARDNSAAFEVNEENRMSDEQLAQANAELQANLEVVKRITKERKYNEKHMNCHLFTSYAA